MALEIAPSDPDSLSNAAYQQALERLYSRTSGVWKLGVERVEALLRDIGNPQLKYPMFHVAGTNGKGSTVATLAALLQGSGLRVGRYTSPHLVDFRERIVVNDSAMSAEAVTAWLERWDPVAVRHGATFFETTTAMAFDFFRESNVDVAVIETGLGGRLDATNVITPIASAVTQIGFDHMEFLGSTLQEIAAEKAGIFKKGVPAVIGELDPVIRELLAALAVKAGATPVITSADWSVSNVVVSGNGTTFNFADNTVQSERVLSTPLVGEFQAHNTATALAMLRAAGPHYAAIAADAQRHLQNIRLSGRFHRAGRFLFDVAHNPDGARALVANIKEFLPTGSVSSLVTILRDKDWRGILTELSAISSSIVVSVAPTAPAQRVWQLEEVAEWGESVGIELIIEPSFNTALERASSLGDTVLITGSFHTVGDAMARLQVDPLAR